MKSAQHRLWWNHISMPSQGMTRCIDPVLFELRDRKRVISPSVIAARRRSRERANGGTGIWHAHAAIADEQRAGGRQPTLNRQEHSSFVGLAEREELLSSRDNFLSVRPNRMSASRR